MTRRKIFSSAEGADSMMIDRRGALIGLGLAGAAAVSYLNMPKALAASIWPGGMARKAPRKISAA